MNKSNRIIFKLLAVVFFLLAVASVLATLFTAPGSSGSPGLFLAVVLAGLGKWLLGKSQEKTAQETFGRAIEIPKPSDEMETPDDRGKKISKLQRDVADGMGDRGKSSGSI